MQISKVYVKSVSEGDLLVLREGNVHYHGEPLVAIRKVKEILDPSMYDNFVRFRVESEVTRLHVVEFPEDGMVDVICLTAQDVADSYLHKSLLKRYKKLQKKYDLMLEADATDDALIELHKQNNELKQENADLKASLKMLKSTTYGEELKNALLKARDAQNLYLSTIIDNKDARIVDLQKKLTEVMKENVLFEEHLNMFNGDMMKQEQLIAAQMKVMTVQAQIIEELKR